MGGSVCDVRSASLKRRRLEDAFRGDLAYSLRALLGIRFGGLSNCFLRGSRYGCGRQSRKAEWSKSPARRSVIRLT